jgi:hypothetical protein
MSGGRRKGAGRKKGFSAIEAQKSREYIAWRVSESLEPLVDVLINKGLDGDIRAIKELFERAFGKATQGIEMSTPKGEAFSVLITDDQGKMYSTVNAKSILDVPIDIPGVIPLERSWKNVGLGT